MTGPPGAWLNVLGVARMRAALDGWRPPTDLKTGLKKIIHWYRSNKAEADTKW